MSHEGAQQVGLSLDKLTHRYDQLFTLGGLGDPLAGRRPGGTSAWPSPCARLMDEVSGAVIGQVFNDHVAAERSGGKRHAFFAGVPSPCPPIVEEKVRRLAAPDIAARKGGEPIVCLTAYTAPIAAALDESCDLLLVGDSLGMVVHGLPNTVGVTMEMMILHGQAVMRGLAQGHGRGRHALRFATRRARGAAFANAAAADEGDRLPGGEGRERLHSAGHHRLSGPARHSGHGPYRPASPGGAASTGGFQAKGRDRGRAAEGAGGSPAPPPRPAASPW